MCGMELWENIYDSVAVKQTWLAVKAVEYVGSVQMNYGYVHTWKDKYKNWYSPFVAFAEH